MPFYIERGQSLHEFEEAWKSLMHRHYWYQREHVFDWNAKSELDEIRRDFNSPQAYYYLAKSDIGSVLGIIRAKLEGESAAISRWEPTVRNELDQRDVAISLIQRVVKDAKNDGCRTIRTTVKGPPDYPTRIWLLKQYSHLGFEDLRGESTELLMPLVKQDVSIPDGMQMVDGDRFSNEELATLVVKCFTSTEADKAIHRTDRTVTELAKSTATLQAIREGRFGRLGPFKAMLVNHSPIAVVGSLIPQQYRKQGLCIICIAGVLPAYRRKGVATSLLKSVMNELQNLGCQYIEVGTPSINRKALSLYEKVGFKRNTVVNWLSKQLA